MDSLFANVKPISGDEWESQFRDPKTGLYAYAGDPTAGQYLGAHFSTGFEDYTLPGRALDEADIIRREKEAGQYDASYYAHDPMTGEEQGPNKYAMSRDDWENSQWYREGIEYKDNMTPIRAQAIAEGYDERRYREALKARGDEVFGAGMKALGFGATLLGGMLDPINLIPFSGGMRGAKAAVQAAIPAGRSAYGAGIAAGMKTGAVEGTLGSAASMLLTMPDLASKGEDIGFVDVMMGLGMGAALGAAFGGAGGMLSAYRGIRAHAEMEARVRELTDRAATEREGIAEFDRSPDSSFLDRAGQERQPINLTDRQQVQDWLATQSRETIETVDVPELRELQHILTDEPSTWLDFAITKIKSLLDKKIKDPLGEEAYFKPGNTEDLRIYARHLIAGKDKPESEAKKSRTMGLYLAEQTIEKPLAIIQEAPRKNEPKGRKLYLALYRLPEQSLNTIVVGVEKGQEGRIVTSFVTMADRKHKNLAFKDFRNYLTKAEKIFYLRDRLSEHPRQSSGPGGSTGDAPLTAAGNERMADMGENVNSGGENISRNDLSDTLRASVDNQTRRDLARGMETALDNIMEGEPVDVSIALHDTGALDTIRNEAERLSTPEERAAAGKPQDLRWDVESRDDVSTAQELTTPERQHEIDAQERADFDSEVTDALRNMEERGDVSQDKMRELQAAEDAVERSQKTDEFGQAILECAWGASE